MSMDAEPKRILPPDSTAQTLFCEICARPSDCLMAVPLGRGIYECCLKCEERIRESNQP